MRRSATSVLGIVLTVLMVGQIIGGPGLWSIGRVHAAQASTPTLIAFERDGNIWVMNDDGSNQRQLTDDGIAPSGFRSFRPQSADQHAYQWFSWSPDGAYLAFTRDNVDGTRDIVLFDALSGTSENLVLNANGSVLFPAWAFDANELLVPSNPQPQNPESDDYHGPVQFLRVLPNGTSSTVATFDQDNDMCGGPSGPGAPPPSQAIMMEIGTFAWRPQPSIQWSAASGSAIVNLRCWETQSFDLNTGEQYALTDNETFLTSNAPMTLLTNAYASAQWNDTPNAFNIFDSGTLQQTATITGSLPSWSPDGSAIYYSRAESRETYPISLDDYPMQVNVRTTSLFRANADGSDETKLADLDVHDLGYPSIASDASWVAVATVANPLDAIAAIPADGSVSNTWMQRYNDPPAIQRIDTATGTTTMLAENAGRPQVQPRGVTVDTPASVPGTPPLGDTPSTPETLLAVSEKDGQVWLMRPDGTERQQISTLGTVDHPYYSLHWSNDGSTLLMQNSAGDDRFYAVWHLGDAQETRVETPTGCQAVGFGKTSNTLVLTCGQNQQTLASVMTLALTDGSTNLLADVATTASWSSSAGELVSDAGMMQDGTLVLSTGKVIGVLPPGETTPTWLDATRQDGAAARIWVDVQPGHDRLIIRSCPTCGEGNPAYSVALLDPDGTMGEPIFQQTDYVDGASLSPDEQTVALAEGAEVAYGNITLVDVTTGSTRTIGQGNDVAWQPASTGPATMPSAPDSSENTAPDAPPFSIPVMVIACDTDPGSSWNPYALAELPSGCIGATEVRLTATTMDGALYSECIVSETRCNLGLAVPISTDVTVALDESSIPGGYVLSPSTPANQVINEKPEGKEFVVAWVLVRTSTTATTSNASGLIAFIGDDNNVWVSGADGSNPSRITTDATADDTVSYLQPAWSHDGTMLTFSSGEGIWLVRDGTQRLVPETHGCSGAGFSVDNTRLLFTCSIDKGSNDPAPADLTTNPAHALVASSLLDGSDRRVEIAYTTDDSGIDWGLGKGFVYGGQVKVNPADGTIMVAISGYKWSSLALFEADGTYLGMVAVPLDSANGSGPLAGDFLPDGNLIVVWCDPGCGRNVDQATRQDHLATVDRQGNVITTWDTTAYREIFQAVSLGPDGATVLISPSYSGGDVGFISLATISADGTVDSAGTGFQGAWQPVAATFTLPTGVQTSDTGGNTATTPPASMPGTTGTGVSTTGSDGLLAYIGSDGNVWVMNLDGTDPVQITTDGSPTDGQTTGSTYFRPSWSHDGTMLTFSKGRLSTESTSTIWLLRDGHLAMLPDSEGCEAPAFTADDAHLLFACRVEQDYQQPDPPAGWESDPHAAFITISDLDGGNQRAFVPRTTETGHITSWDVGKSMLFVTSIAVRPTDGAVLAYAGGFHRNGIVLFDTNGAAIGSVQMGPNVTNGPYYADFVPGSDLVFTSWRERPGPLADTASGAGVASLDGSTTQQWTTEEDGIQRTKGSVAPDGTRAVIVRGPSWWSAEDLAVVNASGQEIVIGSGQDPAWQPTPATLTVPDGTQVVGSASAPIAGEASTSVATSGNGQPVATQAPTAADSATQQTTGAMPASGQLVFAAKDGGQWDLYVHDFATSENIQLTNLPGSDEWGPVYSHDGSRLAYLSNTSGADQVWIMNPDGSNPVQISTSTNGYEMVYVDWSGDDRSLYITIQGDTNKIVLQIPVDGGELTTFMQVDAARPQVIPGGSAGQMYFITDNTNDTPQQIAVASESDPDNYQIVRQGDALLLDPTGSYAVYKTGDIGARRIGVLPLGGAPEVVAPSSGLDDARVVITGPVGTGNILWIATDGATYTLWSSNVTSDPNALVTTTIDTGIHEQIYYPAWRPGDGNRTTPSARTSPPPASPTNAQSNDTPIAIAYGIRVDRDRSFVGADQEACPERSRRVSARRASGNPGQHAVRSATGPYKRNAF